MTYFAKTKIKDSAGNVINPSKEDGNLATLAGKDFATQTTLAQIKAKTDNIDVALSTRTKPSDQQHAIIDSSALPTGASTSSNQSTIISNQTNGTQKTGLVINGTDASAQNPFPNGVDSIYPFDVKDSLTEIGTFTGSILTCFNNLDNEITDTSTTNPKWFKFYLERPIINEAINIVSKTGNFSNVKIELYDRAGTLIYTLDDSANSTQYTSHKYSFEIQKEYCCIKISFLTANPVKIAFIRMLKEQRVSLSNIDPTTSALLTIDHSHAELHAGNHYYSHITSTLGNGATQDVLITTPNTTKWAHMVIGGEAQDGAVLVSLYEGATTSNDGTRDNERNRNRNSSDANTTFVYTGPVVTITGTLISQGYYGSGKSSGGGTRDSEEIILKQNTKYLVRIINQITGDNHVNLSLDWYEHTNIV